MVPCVLMILYKMGYRKRNRTPGRPLRLLAAAALLGSALALWGCAPDEEAKRERQCVTLAGGLHGELIHREAIALADSVNTSESTVYVELKAENQFRLTPEQLKAAITPRTKALVLPFPSNPTGGIMERQDLEALAQVLRDTEIMVVSDEIYAELTYGQRHVSMANLEEMYDRTIVVNGFSKSHAMTGWRMGYVCAPKPIIQCLTKLHQFGIMSAPTVSQYAAIEAMRNGDRDIEHMREEYDSRRRYLVENLRRIGLSCFEPKGAFYVFPDIRSTGLTSNEFCERFLREERVAVIPGSAFGPGGEGFVRACYAASMKDISEAITRMDNFLTNLRRSQGKG